LFPINWGFLLHLQLQTRVIEKRILLFKALAMAHAYSTALLLLISVFAGTQLQGGATATDGAWEGGHATFYTGSSKTMGTFS